MRSSKSTIVIPAQYGSSRFPGKPLAMLVGKTVLQRVIEIAKAAAEEFNNVDVLVKTEDERIASHAEKFNVKVICAPENCTNGTEAAFEAINSLEHPPKYILNLQGDAPLTPSNHLTAMLDALQTNSDADIVTPVVQLTWQQLDALRLAKQQAPFSGTTAIVNANDDAVWFSKNIIPAVRREEELRKQGDLSPVYKHIGLYGYTYASLRKFTELARSHYESLEDLEQLRALENGMRIKVVKVTAERPQIGIDTPYDLQRAEAILSE